MQNFLAWFNRPNVHAGISIVLQFAAQLFPQYAPLLSIAAMTFGGAAVSAPVAAAPAVVATAK